MLRFHTQTGGLAADRAAAENNIVRVACRRSRRCLAAPSRCTPTGYDEALALPTEEAARLALRTQQIIAYESGVAEPSIRSAARTWSRR